MCCISRVRKRTRGREQGLQLGGVGAAAVVCGGRLGELDHTRAAHDVLPLLRAGGAGEGSQEGDGAGGHAMDLDMRQQHVHDVRRVNHLQACNAVRTRCPYYSIPLNVGSDEALRRLR